MWSEECENAFQQLKKMLINAPILKYPDFSKPFKIIVDASDFACGGVLTQSYDDVDMPILYEIYLRTEPYNKLQQLSKPYRVIDIQDTNVKITDGKKQLIVHENRINKEIKK